MPDVIHLCGFSINATASLCGLSDDAYAAATHKGGIQSQAGAGRITCAACRCILNDIKKRLEVKGG